MSSCDFIASHTAHTWLGSSASSRSSYVILARAVTHGVGSVCLTLLPLALLCTELCLVPSHPVSKCVTISSAFNGIGSLFAMSNMSETLSEFGRSGFLGMIRFARFLGPSLSSLSSPLSSLGVFRFFLDVSSAHFSNSCISFLFLCKTLAAFCRPNTINSGRFFIAGIRCNILCRTSDIDMVFLYDLYRVPLGSRGRIRRFLSTSFCWILCILCLVFFCFFADTE
mmetsp:Transcript_32900/g.84296  ORF Transcript_32900/g.84296 Transcript_32900/m.84296 type:complete len:225 (-) Transcript_32900:111-785(-)